MKNSAAILIVTFLAAGCASHARPFASGNLNFDQLQIRNNGGAGYRSPDLVPDSLKALAVSDPRFGERAAISDDEKALLGRRLQQDLEEKIQARNFFKTGTAGGDFQIETLIAKIHPGSPFKRWFWGFGSGSSDVQVEFKLTRTGSAEPLAAYAYRRADGGVSLLGLNVTELSGKRHLEKAMDKAASAFVDFLDKAFKQPASGV
ncbi:MAG TPA: DUF4410 domain-containing protein [Verrucomicrobiae bacterium]|nr:DUF4410 domain-containing protein [Verrucomicrobiae bacterium]